MTPEQLAKARAKIKRRRFGVWLDGIVYWVQIALFGLLVSTILYSCAASAAPRGIPVHRPAVIHHYHHDKGTEPAPYIAIGIITGIVLYSILDTDCDHGVICTRF